MQTIDYHAILAPTILGATILVVLIVDAFLPNRFKWFAMPLSLVGVVATLVADLTLIGQTRSTFGGMYVVDNFTLLFQVFFLAVAIVVLALSLRYFREGGFYQGEYYFLLLTSFLGCLLMPASRDLLMLFISLELVSAPGFLMSAFRKADVKGNEGGIKFFIIGVLSTAVMLYGMSMIFGLTGATRLTEIAAGLAKLSGAQLTLADASILFVVVGFAFKVSAVPFQFWAPDTYEGAPVPVAAFLAVASKAAGFAGLLQLMFVAFIGQAAYWTPLFAVDLDRHDDRGEPGRSPAAAGRAAARVLGDRAGRLHAAPVRAGADRQHRRERERVLRRRVLHPDLRRDEHRGVRGGDGREPPAPAPVDLGLRRPRQGRARCSRSA